MVAKQVIAALAMLAMATPAHADCRQFFVKRQAVVHHAVVQQFAVPYYQPPIYYSAGGDLQAEALAVKVAALVEKKLALRQEQVAPASTEQLSNRVNAMVKCATCHSPKNPAGGIILDGATRITCHTYYRWGQIAGQGKDVPAKMQALVAAMTPEQKGAINEAMLDLVETNLVRVDPLPTPLPPPPLPPRDGDLE